jgi:hypothetical protein
MNTSTLTPFEAALTPDFMSQATTLRLPGQAIDVVDAGVGTKASRVGCNWWAASPARETRPALQRAGR